MGFETRHKYRQRNRNWNYETSLWDLKPLPIVLIGDDAAIMRHPYGIWNLHLFEIRQKRIYYETSLWDLKPPKVPTPSDIETYYETSLWDLKLFDTCVQPVSAPYYETSLWDLKHTEIANQVEVAILWDIPMGFETRKTSWKKNSQLDYETSLWDLKRTNGGNNAGEFSIMRHPYGIWNCCKPWEIFCAAWYYETSLWDLKPWRWLALSYGIETLWDIPMGFETRQRATVSKSAKIMRHPYGIWNSRLVLLRLLLPHYETSLWDLKQWYNHHNWDASQLWDIPMGFETCVAAWKDKKMLKLWDIPMGFETSSPESYACTSHRLWDIPMGFETFWFSSTKKLDINYETSLWDLKLVLLISASLFAVHYETSLWDLKLILALTTFRKQFIMRHPYGIWNLA